jgi:hypothetical protein
MKKILLILWLGLTGFGLRAQADIQAMIKQIAKLEINIVDMEKGYRIAQGGLTTIGEIKKGEFNLHSLFFSSLESVNPSVAKYSKIAGIISDELSIVSAFKSILQKLNGSRTGPNEINYIQAVFSNMSGQCTQSLNSLIDILTDDTLEMTDDERIKRIDGIYSDMEDKQAFTQSFVSRASGLMIQRNDQAEEVGFIKSLE